jgi:predicted solute-binding protein
MFYNVISFDKNCRHSIIVDDLEIYSDEYILSIVLYVENQTHKSWTVALLEECVSSTQKDLGYIHSSQ